MVNNKRFGLRKLLLFVFFTAFLIAFVFGKVEAQERVEFHTDQGVTWRSAIQKLCRAKNWTPRKTFKNCFKYAKKNELVPKKLKIRASKIITEEELAYLLEKSSPQTAVPVQEIALPVVPPAPQEPNPPSAQPSILPAAPSRSLGEDAAKKEIPSKTYPSLSFTPVPAQNIDVHFFANVKLDKPLPNNFYLDEVYFVEGDLVGITGSEAFVFLCRQVQSCDQSNNFLEKTINNHFKIPVFFREPGNFKMGFIPGRSGQSRIVDISVLPEAPLEFTSGGGQPATIISTKYEAGKSLFTWDGDGSFTRLIIFQDQIRKDYLFRHGVKSFAPPSKDFITFKKGNAAWAVQHQTQLSSIQPISLTTQEFRKIDTEKIQIISLEEIFAQAPIRLAFHAKALDLIAAKGALTLPHGQVKEFSIAENDLPAGQEFRLNLELAAPGTYIFEINNPQGSAIVNIPLHVGSELPLLPDFFAQNQAKLNTDAIGDISEARKKLLTLINADRAAFSLQPVSISNELNSVAQAHSENMVNSNFFGHVDNQGLNPDDRRKNAKISTPILENLGKATSLESVEAGLMRSPVHRAVLLNNTLTRVGLGIVKNSEGYFFVTQNFSTEPLQKSDLITIEEELFQKSNAQRTEKNLPLLAHDSLLREVASQWSQKMASENFFSVTAPNGDSLVRTARTRNVTSSIQVNILQTSSKEKLSQELLKQTGLNKSTHLKIGIGLGLNDTGEIFMTVSYTP